MDDAVTDMFLMKMFTLDKGLPGVYGEQGEIFIYFKGTRDFFYFSEGTQEVSTITSNMNFDEKSLGTTVYIKGT